MARCVLTSLYMDIKLAGFAGVRSRGCLQSLSDEVTGLPRIVGGQGSSCA